MQRIKILLLVVIYVTVSGSQELQTTTEPGDNQGRIVGGYQAALGQFPHVVSVRVSGYHVCSGSILSRNAVLTAAHCLEDASDVTVYAGSVSLSSGGTIVNVASIIRHPNYNVQAENGNDVAILRLAFDLTYSSVIQSIRLGTNDPSPSYFRSVTVTGWGRTTQDGPVSEYLNYLRVRPIRREVCRHYFPSLADTSFCLHANRRTGVCFGDSGGAAIYRNRIVGVTSHIRDGCATGIPDIYSRISTLRSWISNNI